MSNHNSQEGIACSRLLCFRFWFLQYIFLFLPNFVILRSQLLNNDAAESSLLLAFPRTCPGLRRFIKQMLGTYITLYYRNANTVYRGEKRAILLHAET